MSIRSHRPIKLASSDAPEPSSGSLVATAPIRTRYVRVRDEVSDEREVFVRSVFGHLACFPFSDEGTFALSRAGTPYAILVLDVADPLRMARYLRVNRALLRNVAKFAVMHESSPPRRARMLVAGCDDVLDIARMSPEEARMRVTAVMRRHHAHWSLWSADQRAATNILTPREQPLLSQLAEQSGKSISVQRLCPLIAPSTARAAPSQSGMALPVVKAGHVPGSHPRIESL